MQEQQYAWLLALAMIAARRDPKNGQDDPSRLVVEDVTGIAGRVKSTHRSAANEVVAALFILCLLFAWLCAKKRAKTLRFDPVFCKFETGPIFWPILGIPHQMGAAGLRGFIMASDKSITSPQLHNPFVRY